MNRIVKTNLSDITHGRCRTRNNSRYSGRSAVWAVEIGDDIWYASNRKWLAEYMAQFASKWDGKGDFEYLVINEMNREKIAYSDSDKLFPCFTPEVATI